MGEKISDGCGHGVIRSLAEAQKAAQDAKREGLLGYYPAACVVLADALQAALGLLDASGVRAPITCWGLSSFCAEVGNKCRASGKCVFEPPTDVGATTKS